MTSTTDITTSGDWQDRLIAAAATVTTGPLAWTGPERVERLPRHLNFEGLIDVDEALRRFELARQGRAFLPALAAWKREVVEMIASGQGPNDLGDDAAGLFWALNGTDALATVLLEIGWVGGDNASEKNADLDSETLDAYAAEVETGGAR